MKNFIERIQEINKTAKGKAVLFFAFYIVFFLVVVLVCRLGSGTTIASGNDYEPGNGNVTLYIDNILKNNYIYSYTVTLDGVKSEYYGQRYDDMELFEFRNKSYYREGNRFYVKNSLWVEGTNPYLFPKFKDIGELSKIIEVANYQSKTSYEDGRKAYNYLISTNTINQLLNGIDSDFLEEPNEITLEADEDKNVKKIELKLNSYCTLNKLCKNSLKIELEYDMFGEVQKIDSPVG